MGDRNELIRLRAENERLKRWLGWGEEFLVRGSDLEPEIITSPLERNYLVVSQDGENRWRVTGHAKGRPGTVSLHLEGKALEVLAEAERLLTAPPQSP